MSTAAPTLGRADLNRVEALLREELDAQRRLQQLLDEQQRAVVARTPEALEDCTRRVEAQLASAAARRQRRETLQRRLAQSLGLAPSAVTVGSLAERAGEHGARLAELRAELRGVVAQVARASRRLGAAVALHRRINGQVIELTLGEGAPRRDAPLGTGTLIDAEV